MNIWRPVALALGAFVLLDKLVPVLRGVAWATSGPSDPVADVGEQAEPLRLLAQASPSLHGGNNSSSVLLNGLHADGQHHSHEALFYLILAIIVGTFVMHLGTFPFFKGMQQTVVLFVLGLLLSFLLSGMHFKEHAGAVGRSYDMWMHIDPHLLLFTLLPPLLAGDAMTIDMVVARKVAKQCLYLAGPGVLINGSACALFLYYYLPYNWDFLLCLSTGAILCATDPVAVVALLKELGASPTLTVQIQGESLLNDGTAIVMFNVAYSMLQGKEYMVGDILAYLVKMAVYAWILGLTIGGFFWLWIKAAKSKLDHASSTIQVLLTIACAYSSFLVAEGIFKISGVLCTVAASLFLAQDVWAEVVSHQTMHTIWHMLENLGNTIIFFLAGSLTGNIMLKIPWSDYLHLLVIYVVLVLLRFMLILCSVPLLPYLVEDRRPVSWADAIVMSWGGLRGAVGLALGIQVSIDRGGGRIDEITANRVLFYVGGVALLTLLINALTCPRLVKWLEITKTPETKRMLMMRLHQQLSDEFLVDYEGREDVKAVLDRMLKELERHIGCHTTSIRLHPDLMATEGGNSSLKKLVTKNLSAVKGSMRKSIVGRTHTSRLCTNQEVIADFNAERERFEEAPEALREHVKSAMLPSEALSCIEDMSALISNQKLNRSMLRAVNEAFLALVRTAYWHQVEENEINSCEFKILVSSVSVALSHPCYELYDFRILRKSVEINESEGFIASLSTPPQPSSRRTTLRADLTTQSVQASWLQRTCESVGFRVAMFLAIIANSVVILIDEYKPATPESPEEIILFGVELGFVVIFTVESAMNFGYLWCQYFLDTWHVFDFALVVMGWVGIILEIIDWGKTGASAHLAQTVRILKVLRTTRLIRLVRSFSQAVRSIKSSETTAEIARHVRKYIIYCAFVRGHTYAQHELMRFLGRHGKPDQVEIARCIMQSLTDCYKAMHLCADEEDHIEPWMLEEMDVCQHSIKATAKMEKILTEARDAGILSSSEAEALMHTMHSYWSCLEHRVDDVRQGRATEAKYCCYEQDDEDMNESTRRNALLGMAEEAARASRCTKMRATFMSDHESQYLRGIDLASPQVIGMTQGIAQKEAPEPAEEPAVGAAQAPKERKTKNGTGSKPLSVTIVTGENLARE